MRSFTYSIHKERPAESAGMEEKGCAHTDIPRHDRSEGGESETRARTHPYPVKLHLASQTILPLLIGGSLPSYHY